MSAAYFPALADGRHAARFNRIKAQAASPERARQTFARQALRGGHSAEEVAGALWRVAGVGPARAADRQIGAQHAGAGVRLRFLPTQ